MEYQDEYINIIAYLSNEAKRLRAERNLYKSLWEQAEAEVRKLKEEDPDVYGVPSDAL